MRFILHATVVLALGVPVAARAPKASGYASVCRGSMEGSRLTTTLQFGDGYAVAAPWRIMQDREGLLSDGAQGIRVGARLNRIIEADPETGLRQSTPFPSPVDITFQGRDRSDLIARAARIWCASVLKARTGHARENAPRLPDVARPPYMST